ncbi:MAG: AAA family ATPase [Methanoregula sp.]|jgi:AAA15 family ATPase/GTPase|nr:AAA family ATPase [Methanoregula sp.]
MSFISDLQVHNFRAIRDLHYKPKKINIITGRNNTGKTALLDAIAINASGFIHLDSAFSYEPLTFVNVSEQIAEITSNLNKITIFSSIKALEENQGDSISQEIYNEAISNLLSNKNPELKDIFQNKEFQEEYLKLITEYLDFITITSNFGQVVCQYFKNGDIGQKQYSDVIRKLIKKCNKEKPMNRISIFRLTFPHIVYLKEKNSNEIPKVVIVNHENKLEFDDISEKELVVIEEFLKENNLVKGLKRISQNDVVYQRDGKLITLPITSHGDGFISLLNTVRYLISAKDGILVIEEPENHMHPRYIDIFISNIFSFSQTLNVQVFMSTHSIDLVRAALQYPNTDEEKDMLLISKMTSDGETIEKFDYTVKEGLRVTEELYLDLRGN